MHVGWRLTGQFRNKESQPDTNRSHESRLMFLRREHQDGKDEEGSEEHLDEHALRDADSGVELRESGSHVAGKHALNQCSCNHGSDDLSREEEHAPHPWKRARDAQAQDDCGVE